MEQIDVQEEVDAILSCADLLFKEANKNVVTKKDIYFNAQEILQRKIKGERRALIKARLMDLIDEFEFDDKAQVAVGVEAQLKDDQSYEDPISNLINAAPVVGYDSDFDGDASDIGDDDDDASISNDPSGSIFDPKQNNLSEEQQKIFDERCKQMLSWLVESKEIPLDKDGLFKTYQTECQDESWNIFEEVFKNGAEKFPEYSSLWKDVQKCVQMYPPQKDALFGYFLKNTVDLANPGRLIIDFWHYCPHASIGMANGFLILLLASGLFLFAAKTFRTKYVVHFAAAVCCGLCEQKVEHMPLANMARMNAVPGIHSTRTYKKNGGFRLGEEGTYNHMPPPPLDLEVYGLDEKKDWEFIVKTNRKAIPVFVYFLVELYKFEIFLRANGNHVKFLVQNESLFKMLLNHQRVHVEFVMHASALGYPNPKAAPIDHHAKVDIKCHRFIQGHVDFNNEEIADGFFEKFRAYYPVGLDNRVKCEYIEMSDSKCQSYVENAKWKKFNSIKELAEALKVHYDQVSPSDNRSRGVVRSGNRIFFVRRSDSDEEFPKPDGRITLRTVKICRVKMIVEEDGSGKLERDGPIITYGSIIWAAERLVELSREEKTRENIAKWRNNLGHRMNGYKSLSFGDPFPIKSPKWMVANSDEKLEHNIATERYQLTSLQRVGKVWKRVEK